MKAFLKVSCQKDNLLTIREFIRTRLKDLDVPGKISHQIILATDEACANCIIHSHQCNGHSSIEVGIYKEGKTISIEIRDTGEAFPIHTYQPKQLHEIVKSRKKGGLGIMLIKKLMDEVKVEESDDFFVYKLSKHLHEEVLQP